MDLTRPYLYFFVIGLAHAFWGLMIWIMFALHWINYPGFHHARALNEGFLLSFATGFILTFFPKTTRTFSVKKSEFFPLVFFALLAGVTDWAALGGLITLFIFAITRIKKTPHSKLPTFVFAVVSGMICGILGLILKIASLNYKPFLYEGMILFWLIGVGSFLLPMLTQSFWKTPEWAKRGLPWICGLLFLGFALEAFDFGIEELGQAARALRFALIAFVAVYYWHIHQKPFRKGYLTLGVWVALASIILGYFVRLVAPSLDVHALHIVYIMGYSLITLMVAIRISISHGSGNFQIEMKYKRVLIFAGFILLAGATRFSVFFMPERMVNHFAYASFTWLTGVLIWLSFIFPIWKKHLFKRTAVN